MNNMTAILALSVITFISGSCLGVGYHIGYSKCNESSRQIGGQLVSDVKRVQTLEEFYHEKLKGLPECWYDPTVYNSLFYAN